MRTIGIKICTSVKDQVKVQFANTIVLYTSKTEHPGKIGLSRGDDDKGNRMILHAKQYLNTLFGRVVRQGQAFESGCISDEGGTMYKRV